MRAGHLLRKVDEFLDFSSLCADFAPLYSHAGRPSVDPELMIRVLLIGYLFGNRSETRLCEEVHLNFAYLWFCRLGLEDVVPDRSTFSQNPCGRFVESDVLWRVFEMVVAACGKAGSFAIGAHWVRAEQRQQLPRPIQQYDRFLPQQQEA